MIKRADGSYSKHGLWDSIRENKGSGKAPTKEMLKQEKKIKAKYEEGGELDNINNVPIPSPFPSKQNFKFKNYQDLKTLPVKLNSNNFSPYTNIPDKKIIGSEDYKDPLTNILNQTIADQTNLGRGYNVGSEILSSYENPYLKTINSGLELVKSKTPIIGDLLINTGQEALSGVDNYLKNNNNYNSRLHDKIKNMKYNNGGTIHIKPENKGKFNATKKATGKTTEELTHSKNPVTKKRAIFAQNAAKWQHAEGGEIPINPIITKPIGPPTIGNNFINSNPLNYNLDFLNNANNSNFNYNQVQVREDGGIPSSLTEDDGSYFDAKMLSPKDQLFIKEMKNKQLISEYGNNEKIPQYGKASRPSTGDEYYVLDAYAKGGRVLPKYAEAGWLTKNKAGVGAGLGFAGDTTNLLFDNNVFGTRNKVTDSEGNELGEAQSDAGSQTQGALSGALKGASAGAALGPWGMAGGALIGGVAGFLTADTGAEDKLNQIKRERNAQISFKNMLGKGPIENNAIQTNSLALSAYGGYINKKYAEGGMKTLNQNHPEATEEVELGESAMLPNGMNLAFGGETHENGGLETNLPEGTRIFSDRIKSGKRTIASIAKPIQNKIEKLKDNNSKAGQNTIKLFENQLDNLFNEQEEIKQQQDMAQQRKYFAKGGLIKYSGLDGKPGVIQKPYSFADNFEESKMEVPRINAKNIYAQGTLDPNNPSAREMLGIKPNYVPANSDQADYENSLKEQNSLHNYLGMTQDDMMKMVNNRSLTKTPEGYYYMNNNVPNGGKGDFDKNLDQPEVIPPPSEPRFNKGDIGTAGALGTSLLGNLIQRSNLNKVAPPRTLVAPTFTAGRTPVKADYSADLQSADNQFNAARRGVMMNSGNYSTQAGNLGQLRAEQLRNRSKILQNQNNANAVLMNEYQKAQADAINKNALSNYTTDQSNMENLYNYNLWKTGQTNAADASAFNTSGQMFNNMVTGQNQLDAAEMYRRMYAQKVQDDLAFKKAMGGTVRNYFAKGGTVYSQKLQEQINQPTINNAAAMDAEYASYLDAKGQPLQDTFKSKVTDLEYKVLPRKEKDLYAANLWKDIHSTAPTKKQVEATTKAIEGKKTSSPGAKTVADTHNSQVPQLEVTLPEVVITGKRSLNPQQMMDNKFGKPQVSSQPPAIPSKPVPDWVNKANNAKPNFNQPNVNEPVNEKPVVNKPKLQTETPNWLKNPLQPKFNRNEVGEPDNTGSSFNPDTNESIIEKGKKYVNNTLKPAIQEGRKRLNEYDLNVAKKANIRSLSNIGENISKKIEKNWKERGEAPSPSEAAKLLLAGYNENYKQTIPTSIRNLAKDIVNNNLGTNMKITEDDLTQTEKTAILELANKKENLSKKNKNYSKSINSYNDYKNDNLDGDQWSDIKNIRNSLGKFNPVQDGDTLRIKEKYNFNEKDNKQVIESYGKSFSKWKEKGYSSAMAMVRALGTRFGSPGSEKGNDNLYGTDVDIKLYNPKKRTLKK